MSSGTRFQFVLTFFLAASAVVFLPLSADAQKDLAISEIQGEKNISAHENEKVRVTGIVTATTNTGFFLQTPDDKIDANPKTSEGIFVFTKNAPPAEAVRGNLVTVTGTVEEFRGRNDTRSLTITEISFFNDRDKITVVSRNNPLPKAIVLTAADFRSNQIDQLEKFEGMRLSIAEFTVIAPTDGRVDIKTASSKSDGAFYGVVKGLPRPFREPGLDLVSVLTAPEKEKARMKSEQPKIAIFDTNPERLRVETTTQILSGTVSDGGSGAEKPTLAVGFATPIEVAAGTELRNINGVLHYSRGTYTVLTDLGSKPAVANSVRPVALPAPTARQFVVAGANLENFFDDKDDPDIKEDVLEPAAFERRLKKISLAVRNVLQNPDVLGVIEVENLATLRRLAERINADSLTGGKENPKYEAFLVDGNDGRGIDSGFLVKTSRVRVIETKQLGKADKFKNPNSGGDDFLNDRPPFMLRAAIDDAGKPFEFTVVVNHLKSLLGYDDPKQMDNVRLKKKLQAEYLAKFVQERIKANPSERIMLIGDFNAFQFNDGVMDVVGTIKGNPSTKDSVLIASDDLLNPDMINLVDLIKGDQRYSYTFDGNAQTLDHILITENLKSHVKGFGFARVNADFPESYRNDENRPEKFSDHDPAVAYFSLDAAASAGAKP